MLEIRPNGGVALPSFATRAGAATAADLDALEAEIITARDGLVDLDTRLDQMRDNADATNAEVVAAREGSASLDAKLDLMEAATSAAQAEVDAVQAEVVAARDGNASLDARLDIMGLTTTEVVNARGGEANLDARLDSIEAESATKVDKALPITVTPGSPLVTSPDHSGAVVNFNIPVSTAEQLRNGLAPGSVATPPAVSEIYVELTDADDVLTSAAAAAQSTANTVTNEVIAARDGNASLDARLDILGLTTTEVVNARGGEANLDARLDSIEAEKVDKTLSITVTPGSPLITSPDHSGGNINFNIPQSTAEELRSGLHPASVATPPAVSELYDELTAATAEAQNTANLAMAAIENAHGSSDSLDHRLDAIEATAADKVDKALPITVTPGSPLVVSPNFAGANINFNIPVATAEQLRNGLTPGSVATPPAVSEIYDELTAADDALEADITEMKPRATTHVSSTTGSSVEYVASGTPPLASMALGRMMTVTLHTACGANPYITIDGIRARMVKPNGGSFAEGELPSGNSFTFVSRPVGSESTWRFVNWQEWMIDRLIVEAFEASEADAVKARNEAIARAVSLPGRPGEFPQQWSDATLSNRDLALVGPVQDRPEMNETFVETIAGMGTALLLTSQGVVAPRTSYRIEPGQVYRIRAVGERETNPLDPAGDAVVFKLRCLTYALQGVALPGGDIELDRKDDLTEASGRWTFVKTFSVTPGMDTDFVLPASTAYATPYFEIHGSPVAVYIEVLTPPINLTDAMVWAPDVSAFDARLQALESQDLATRLSAVEAFLSGSEVKWFKSRADFEAAAAGIDPAIPAGVDIVMTYQRWADRSGGGAKYTRTGTAPNANADYVVDAVNGGWWVLDVEEPSFLQLGIRPGDVATSEADNFTRLQNALTLGPVGRKIRIGEPGIYRYLGNLSCPQGREIEGAQDHLNAYALKCSALSGWAFTVEGQSCNLHGFMLSATPERYDAVTTPNTAGGFLFLPENTAVNRQRASRLLSQDHPGDGFYVVGGAQGTILEQCSAYYCKGAGFRTDDGTAIAYADKANAGLVTLNVFKAVECGGQAISIGAVGSTWEAARVDIKQAEITDCAYLAEFCNPIRVDQALPANCLSYTNGSNVLTVDMSLLPNKGHGVGPSSHVKFSGLVMAGGWSNAEVNDKWLQAQTLTSMSIFTITMDTPAVGSSAGDGGAAATWAHHIGTNWFVAGATIDVDNSSAGGADTWNEATTGNGHPKPVLKAPPGGVYWHSTHDVRWGTFRFIHTAFAGMADAEGPAVDNLPTSLCVGIDARAVTLMGNPVWGDMPFGFLFPKGCQMCSVKSRAVGDVAVFMWSQEAVGLSYKYNDIEYLVNPKYLKGNDIARSLLTGGPWRSDTLDTSGQLAINGDKMNVVGLIAGNQDNWDYTYVYADSGLGPPASDLLIVVRSGHDAPIVCRSVGNHHLPRGNVTLQPGDVMLMQYDVATDKWADVGKLGTTFNSNVAVPAGAVATPGITVGADTGFARIAAGHMALSLSGVQKASWKDGEFLWGGTVLEAVGSINAGFQLQGTNASRASLSSVLFNPAATVAADLLLAHSRGATLNSHGLLLDDDLIGRVRGVASDGTAWRAVANVTFGVDGTTGVGDIPSYVAFMTSPDGAAVAAEAARFDSAKNFKMNGENVVIDFNRLHQLRLTTVGGAITAAQQGRAGFFSNASGGAGAPVWDSGSEWRQFGQSKVRRLTLDQAETYSPLVDGNILRDVAALTATRIITLASTNVTDGHRVTISRRGATGGFTRQIRQPDGTTTIASIADNARASFVWDASVSLWFEE